MTTDIHRAPQPPRPLRIGRWLRRSRSGADAGTAPSRRPRSNPQPMWEAFAIGFGCESFDHRMASPPEWR